MFENKMNDRVLNVNEKKKNHVENTLQPRVRHRQIFSYFLSSAAEVGDTIYITATERNILVFGMT